MMRVLQLLGVEADFQTRRTADLLLRQSGFEVRRLSVGRGGDCRDPLVLARHLRSIPREDLVHAFGTAALTTAALVGRSPVLGTLDPLAGSRAIGWLSAVMGHRPLQVVCGSAVQHRAAVRRGLPEDRCHLIRPGVEFSRVGPKRNLGLREALGFGSDDVVLLAPGESTRAAGHERAAWVASILHVLDPRYKLLIWGEGPQAAVVAGMSRRLRQDRLVTAASRRLRRAVDFESVVGVADLSLLTPAGAFPALPTLCCMAAGLPIVAVTTAATSELLEDRHTAWMTTTNSPRELARRVLDVRADDAAAWAFGDRARSEVFDLFPASRMLGEYRPLMARAHVAGLEPVHVGQLADGHKAAAV